VFQRKDAKLLTGAGGGILQQGGSLFLMGKKNNVNTYNLGWRQDLSSNEVYDFMHHKKKGIKPGYLSIHTGRKIWLARAASS